MARPFSPMTEQRTRRAAFKRVLKEIENKLLTEGSVYATQLKMICLCLQVTAETTLSCIDRQCGVVEVCVRIENSGGDSMQE